MACKEALNLLVGYNEGADLRVEYNEGFEFAYRCRALSSPNRLASCCHRRPTDNWSRASFYSQFIDELVSTRTVMKHCQTAPDFTIQLKSKQNIGFIVLLIFQSNLSLEETNRPKT